MNVHIGPDHPCAFCGVMVYQRVETILLEGRAVERFATYKVERYGTHVCTAPVDVRPLPVLTRCPSCRLSVFEMDGVLYDDNAATGRHACGSTEPMSPAPTPAPAPPPMAGTEATREQWGTIVALRRDLGIVDRSDLPARLSEAEAAAFISHLEGELHGRTRG